MKILVLNSTNYVAGSGNKFIYQFPNNPKFQDGDQMAVVSFGIYNSVFNITSANNNNSFQLIINYLVPITLTINFTNGFYDIPTINNYIHNQLLLNKYYTINPNGTYNY